jgi:maltose alpha-D-glucosyltransferase/alpha-amylase
MESWQPGSIVMYAVLPRAYQDSNGDGIGDLGGVLQRLDYLQQLGVTCVWILPFFPSGGRDNGYDITNYTAVSPEYGSLDTFRRIVDQAHRRGMQVVIDLVAHHTSDQHPWFQDARTSAASAYRDYYIWAREPPAGKQPENIFPTIEDGVWHFDEAAQEYYFHLFYKEEPDLNFANPDVQQEMLLAADFWMAFGIDGFRLDALNHLFEDKGIPGTGATNKCEFLARLRAVMAAYNPHAFLIAEADTDLSEVKSFCCNGEGIQLFFNFTLDNYIFLALARESAGPMLEGLDLAPPHPSHWTWLNFLRNIDELDLEQLSQQARKEVWDRFAPDPGMRSYDRGIRRRLAPMLEGDPRWLKFAHSLMFSLPGVPLIVYGDEIGMGDDLSRPERESVRAPMQWNGGPFAGFSSRKPDEMVNPIIADEPFGFARVNVASQIDNDDSLLCFLQTLCELRQHRPWLGARDLEAGTIEQENECVLVFEQRRAEHRLVTVHNFSSRPQTVSLVGPDVSKMAPFLVCPDCRMADEGNVELAPYGYVWLETSAE